MTILFLLVNTLFVKIKFNEKAILNYYDNLNSTFELYFINKKRETEEFNGIDKLKLKYNYDKKTKNTFELYQMLYTFKLKTILAF